MKMLLGYCINVLHNLCFSDCYQIVFVIKKKRKIFFDDGDYVPKNCLLDAAGVVLRQESRQAPAGGWAAAVWFRSLEEAGSRPDICI